MKIENLFNFNGQFNFYTALIDVALISTHVEQDALASSHTGTAGKEDSLAELHDIFAKKDEKPSVNFKNDFLSRYTSLNHDFGSFTDETTAQYSQNNTNLDMIFSNSTANDLISSSSILNPTAKSNDS